MPFFLKAEGTIAKLAAEIRESANLLEKIPARPDAAPRPDMDEVLRRWQSINRHLRLNDDGEVSIRQQLAIAAEFEGIAELLRGRTGSKPRSPAAKPKPRPSRTRTVRTTTKRRPKR